MTWYEIIIEGYKQRFFKRIVVPKLSERKKDVSSMLTQEEITLIERGTSKSHTFTALSIILSVALLVFYLDFVFIQKGYISLGLMQRTEILVWVKIIVSGLALMLASPLLISYLFHKVSFGARASLLLSFEKIADTRSTWDSGKRSMKKGVYRTNFENLLPWGIVALVVFILILAI